MPYYKNRDNQIDNSVLLFYIFRELEKLDGKELSDAFSDTIFLIGVTIAYKIGNDNKIKAYISSNEQMKDNFKRIRELPKDEARRALDKLPADVWIDANSEDFKTLLKQRLKHHYEKAVIASLKLFREEICPAIHDRIIGKESIIFSQTAIEVRPEISGGAGAASVPPSAIAASRPIEDRYSPESSEESLFIKLQNVGQRLISLRGEGVEKYIFLENSDVPFFIHIKGNNCFIENYEAKIINDFNTKEEFARNIIRFKKPDGTQISFEELNLVYEELNDKVPPSVAEEVAAYGRSSSPSISASSKRAEPLSLVRDLKKELENIYNKIKESEDFFYHCEAGKFCVFSSKESKEMSLIYDKGGLEIPIISKENFIYYTNTSVDNEKTKMEICDQLSSEIGIRAGVSTGR